MTCRGLPWWLSGKESAWNVGSIPGSGRSPGERNGNLLQYSCLENFVDRGAWWAAVCGITRVVHDLVTKQQEKSSPTKKNQLHSTENSTQCSVVTYMGK